MAKILAYDDEARQKLASGVSKLARAVRSTLGPRGRNAVIDKGWGSPDRDQGRRDRGRGDRADRSLREHGGSARQGSRLQDLRRGRRRHDHRDRAGRGDLQGRASRPWPPAPTPMALKRGIDKAVEAIVENVKAQSKKVSGKKEITEVAVDRRQQRHARSARSWPTPSRRSAPTASSPSRKARASRPPSTSSRACSSTAAT